jgi:hypothetical protein
MQDFIPIRFGPSHGDVQLRPRKSVQTPEIV